MIKILWCGLEDAVGRKLSKVQELKEFLGEFNKTNGYNTYRALLEITAHIWKPTAS